MGAFDVVPQVSFYQSYHSNKINQLIHFVFVPTIYWTALVFFTAIPVPFPKIDVVGVNIGNPSVLLWAFYAFYYLTLDLTAGALYFPVLFGMLVTANNFAATQESALYYAAIVHVISWVMQFIGHGVFEGRKPALVDNLFQSIVLAPFFVWLELLFTVGYRPSLRKQIDSATAVKLQAFRSKAKK
eukprot:TRINITY_DN12869_c0_g1_i1.p1 TRINITY_DN12869_c0_g1~~TRINITY_DN12869_c0_g1_i1.p1  ORF type:complete len:185 (-),score=35.54 TRINITY_DN12869_c0_g1_i1:111-665(-)